MQTSPAWQALIIDDLNESGFPSKVQVIAFFARFPAFSSISPKSQKGSKHQLITEFFALCDWTPEFTQEFLSIYSREFFDQKYDDYEKDLDHADYDEQARRQAEFFGAKLERFREAGLLYTRDSGLTLAQ